MEAHCRGLARAQDRDRVPVLYSYNLTGKRCAGLLSGQGSRQREKQGVGEQGVALQKRMFA